jgi:hypothetical protein
MAQRSDEPNSWPDVAGRGVYARLVALARRRLVGYEHLAEDVVSRSMVRWTAISPDRLAVARIEQVIKSEAYSVLRSEKRARNREARVSGDPANPVLGTASRPGAEELVELRVAIAETCRRENIGIAEHDVEVLELLFAGHTMSEVVRLTGLARHTVKQSRRTWQQVLRLTGTGTGRDGD